jgi:hypothetical protein
MLKIVRFVVNTLSVIVNGMLGFLERRAESMATTEQRVMDDDVEKERNRRIAANAEPRSRESGGSTDRRAIRGELEGFMAGFARGLFAFAAPFAFIHIFYAYGRLGYDLLPVFFQNYIVAAVMTLVLALLYLAFVYFYVNAMYAVMRSKTYTTVLLIAFYGFGFYMNSIVRDVRKTTVITMSSPFCPAGSSIDSLSADEKKLVGVWARRLGVDSNLYDYSEYCWNRMFYDNAGAVEAWKVVKPHLVKYGSVTYAYHFDDKGDLIYVMDAKDAQGKPESLIYHKANPAELKRHYTAQLVFAVERNHPEYIKQLVKRGADIDAYIRRGMTLLMYAARQGNKTMVEKLVAMGAEKTFRDKDLKTARDYAREYGHAELLGILTDTRNK